MTTRPAEFDAEVEQIKADVKEMFQRWDQRSADPAIVTHVVLVRMIALSMSLFDSSQDHQVFFKDVMSKAIALHHEVSSNATSTVH